MNVCRVCMCFLAFDLYMYIVYFDYANLSMKINTHTSYHNIAYVMYIIYIERVIFSFKSYQFIAVKMHRHSASHCYA